MTKRRLMEQKWYDCESVIDAEEDISWNIDKLKEMKGEEFKGIIIITIEYEEEE